jgi:2-oxoglutarate dehydrogenase E2 component (dihydrolipoamide succinyltransferase)
MAKFEVVMPKMGESIIEATITRWLKAEGDNISEDETIVEIATDKVDSEIPSPVEGILTKLLFKVGDVVPVGAIIAIIDMGGESSGDSAATPAMEIPVEKQTEIAKPNVPAPVQITLNESDNRFYSPLVKSIAKAENITKSELAAIAGTGKDARVTKDDLMKHLKNRLSISAVGNTMPLIQPETPPSIPVSTTSGDQIIEMDRMRKLIADHMVSSVKISPHVTSFVEVDMTRIVNWREKEKNVLLKRENEKLTFTHIFVHSIAKAIKEFPLVNSSVDGNKIIVRKNVNIGMAVALPSGNLIVPVIKNADEKSLLGIVKNVNNIAERARANKLQPDEIQGGTITLTNLGSFGTLLGTPIINQPQVAIVAVGTIQKRPVVVETPEGDVIAIRQMMYLSLSYDHRVIDGALGGKYIYRLKEILENFDISQSI